MKAALTMVLGLVVAFVFTANLQADKDDKKDAKEVTLKGTITCAKCDLKKAKECATVLVVKGKKDGDKDVVYYFDAAGDKENHKPICTKAKKGKVTGTVSEEDGKKTITVSKVEFDK